MSHSICNHRWEHRLDRPVPVQMEREAEAAPSEKKPGCGQTAAGVAADCTAICCCCPFGLISLFYVSFVKLPVAIVIRSAQWMKRRAHKCRHDGSCSCKSRKASLLYSCADDGDSACFEKEKDKDFVFVFDSSALTKEEMELEKEMMLNLSGFGRSLSRRHEHSATD